MKHFILYFLAAVLIVSMLGRFAAAETVESDAAPAAASASVSKDPSGSGLEDGEGDTEAALNEIFVGLLQVNLSSMDDMYFKNGVVRELGDGVSLHALSTSDEGEDQPAMFRKMVEKGYQLIIVELYDADMAKEYIDLAKENGIALIFTGDEPDAEQMARMDDLYYVGFSAGNTMRVLADAIITGWNTNQAGVTTNDDGRLVYGVFTQEDYEANGNLEALERYLTDAGIEEVVLGNNIVAQAFDFNWKKEVDDIFYAKGDLIICDSSSYARQVSDYLHDDEEYPEDRYARLRETAIFLMVADEAAQAMVEEGTAVFCTGINGGDTGAAVGKLARLLLAGEKPTAENIGIAPDENKCISVTNRTILSPRLTTPAAEIDEDDGY